MEKTVQGTIHGKMIELNEETGLGWGQVVEVTVKTIAKAPAATTGEGFVRTEGALTDDDEWDGIMDELRRERSIEHRPPVADLEIP